jgi:hypothetical protein
MSSSVYIPAASSGGGSFTPPASISVKTASYTIPAGRYARVLVNLEGSATFTINAVLALRGTQNSVINAGATIGVLSTVMNTNYMGSNVGTAAFTNATDQKTVVQDFWCPTGTVISGTLTWRAVVEEYTV